MPLVCFRVFRFVGLRMRFDRLGMYGGGRNAMPGVLPCGVPGVSPWLPLGASLHLGGHHLALGHSLNCCEQRRICERPQPGPREGTQQGQASLRSGIPSEVATIELERCSSSSTGAAWRGVGMGCGELVGGGLQRWCLGPAGMAESKRRSVASQRHMRGRSGLFARH